MRLHLLSMLSLPLVLADCKRPTAPPTAASSASAATPVARSPSSADPSRDARFVEVERVVTLWQQTQNSLNFEAYSGLYAASFVGTKRVGEQSYRFDRKRWLLDRKAMFTKGLNVGVSQLKLTASSGNVVAFFQQDFQTPAFRDTGRKLLAFANTPQGFRIVREEMLTSQVKGGGGSVRAVPGFFFARPDGVVLRSELDERWLTPARREIARQFRVARDNPGEDVAFPEQEDFVRPHEIVLPPEVTAFVGKKLYVTQAPVDGTLPAPCESRVKHIRLLNTAAPNFESVRGGMGHDHLFSVVVFGEFESRCPGALWASESPPGTQYVPRSASGARLAAAKAAFLSRASYPAREITEQTGSESRDFLFARGWRDGNDGERQILNLLFSVTGAESPRLLQPIEPDIVPRLAFDADSDGQFEILTHPGGDWATVSVLQLRGEKLLTTPVYSVPDFVCPG